MKHRIYFNWEHGADDTVEFTGENIEDLRTEATAWFLSRGLDPESCVTGEEILDE